jgi:hypothetical protein
MICLYSTVTTRPARIRNTIIRTKKIRGEDNLKGSRFRAMADPRYAEAQAVIWHRRGAERQAGI